MKGYTKFPTLPYKTWNETLDTLHLWIQIVGKIKLKQNNFLNHWWEVALFPTTCGVTTGRIPYKNIAFEISFDFLSHTVVIATSEDKKKKILLKPQTVANFYQELNSSLVTLGIKIKINTFPSEMPGITTPFEKDTTHKSYDKQYSEKWFQILLQTSFILDEFRSRFRGKSSPVQFFWGSFDLTTSRFSGKKLSDKTDWPKGYHFMRYAENEENFACGFWPGNEKFPEPAFYSYLYPAPVGCETIDTGSVWSYFDNNLTECILPYEEVRKAKNPKEEILNFFEITYREYAKLAGWDINDLQTTIPRLS